MASEASWVHILLDPRRRTGERSVLGSHPVRPFGGILAIQSNHTLPLSFGGLLSQSDTHKSISSLSDCLTDISLWMKSSKLKLNSDKTEVVIIGTKQQRHKLSNHFPVKLLDNDMPNLPSLKIRNG